MPSLLNHIARYAVQKLASDPRAKEKAIKVARIVGDEVRQIARGEDKARVAGRVARRTINELRGVRRD